MLVEKREKRKAWVGKTHFNLHRVPEYTGWLWSGIKSQKLTSFVGTRFKKLGSTKEKHVIP